MSEDSAQDPPKPGPEPPDESTSLLAKHANGGAVPAERDSTATGSIRSIDGDEEPAWWRLLGHEFAVLLRGALPVIVAYTLQMSLQTLSIVVVGRASPADLSTAAFAYMFAMATAWLVGLGGSTALDTLAAAAFTGSHDPTDLGVLLQRAFIVLGAMYVPVAVLWVCSEPVFLLLGQDPDISRDSARFLTCLVPGGLGYIYFEAMKKYLQAQEIMRPGTYVLLITSPLNVGLNYLFVYTFGIGLLGAPLATGLSYWLSFALLVAYARFVRGGACWGGWSRRSLAHLGTFARLALLGLTHVGSEWWAFEIVAIVAGQLGPLPLAAQSVIMTSDQIINTVPFGLGVATSARVGNLLGARDAKGAARAAHAAALLSMLLGAVVLAVLMAARHDFARLFNDDEDVVRLTAAVLPAVALFQIADGLAGSNGGSLRGMGRQHVGAGVNMVSYYAGALPLGIYLAFHGWGLAGLWWGNCIALYIAGVLEWVIVGLTNWERQVAKAFERMDRDERVESGGLPP